MRHHSAYFPADILALLHAIAAAASSKRVLDVKRGLCDGEVVLVHSHIRHRAADPGTSVVHLFRFEGELIAEMWDVGQPVPPDNSNADGIF